MAWPRSASRRGRRYKPHPNPPHPPSGEQLRFSPTFFNGSELDTGGGVAEYLSMVRALRGLVGLKGCDSAVTRQ